MSNQALISIATSVIPSSPADLKKINDAIDEMVNSKTLAAAQTQLQTDIVNRLHDEFKINKTWIRNAATDRYNNSFDKKVREQDEYEVFFEKLQANKK